MRSAIIVAVALVAAGCGGAHRTTASTAKASPTGLRVGVVGPLDVNVPGTIVRRVSLARLQGVQLVLVAASAAGPADVAAAATSDPTTSYALVGASTKGHRRPNLVGLVIRGDQSARLAGVVAAFVVKEAGGADPRVAWVGPHDAPFAAAFARGVHDTLPGATVLRAWSIDVPGRCKEAALGAIARGATVVAARGGLCAAAAADGAREQNHVALSTEDFELPDVPAAIVVRDAVHGVFRGNEDLVFGAASGAIGVRRLDRGISAATALRARTAAQQLASGLPPSG